MDYRFFEWVQLLPPNTRFVVRGAPHALHDLLPAPIDPAGNSLLGWELGRPDLPDLTRFETVVLVRPRGVSASTLARAGFHQTVAFTAIPSLSATHWLLPLGDPRISVSGLSLVTPWRYQDRLKAKLLRWIARAGQLRRAGDTILLGRRSKSELESSFEKLFGLPRVALSLKTGQPKSIRKTTIQVMTARGDIVGFAKLATSIGPRTVVEREVTCLRELGAHPRLQGRIPRLLGTLELGDSYLSILAPGPSRPGPTVFGEPHQTFLAALRSATRQPMPFRGSAMWKDMLEKREALLPNLSASWRTRILTATERVDQILGLVELPLATAHRDFGPWNTRQAPNGDLFVFDWDNARREMIPLYDMFSFQLLNYANVARGEPPLHLAAKIISTCRRWESEIESSLIPALFLTYLAESALSHLMGTMRDGEQKSHEALTIMARLLDHHAEWLGDSLRP